MHIVDFLGVGALEMDIQGLTLVNEGASSHRKIDDRFLGDLPDCPVQLTNLLRDLLNILDGSTHSLDLVLDGDSPKSLKGKRVLNLGGDLPP